MGINGIVTCIRVVQVYVRLMNHVPGKGRRANAKMWRGSGSEGCRGTVESAVQRETQETAEDDGITMQKRNNKKINKT